MRGSGGERKEEKIPQKMRPVFDAVVAITDAFCREHLTDEYAWLCRRAAAALSRKRPSPLATGRVETWACGIAYAMGSVNFLFDRAQTPYMDAGRLCEWFGVAKSTAGAKAKAVRDALGIGMLDPRWTLPSRLADNPLAWMIKVNGLVVDVRRMPREVQAEAFRLGLIPYLP